MSPDVDEALGDPRYEWALASEPDTLYVQLPPVDSTTGATGAAGDAMKLLFRQRGFAAVPEDASEAPVANGCALVREDDERAVLVVSISERIGATRIPLPHGDPAWSRRVFAAGQVVAVLTEAAVVDGTVTPERLQRDADADGVSAAVVPAGEL